MISYEDLPTDPSQVEGEASEFAEDSAQRLVDTVIILGQLDPLEIDLTTGQPRWNETQRASIIEAKTLLATWQE